MSIPFLEQNGLLLVQQNEKSNLKSQKRKNIFQKGLDKHPKMEYNEGNENKKESDGNIHRVKGTYYGSYKENEIGSSRRT